ncbi:hypothetical protein BDFG_00590 [Blastomyces dermatitidis ATCC 26199]|nr:hypothetical protein BDFG_00590 [Blastomyces dermatitidis ATCC 26199]
MVNGAANIDYFLAVSLTLYVLVDPDIISFQRIEMGDKFLRTLVDIVVSNSKASQFKLPKLHQLSRSWAPKEKKKEKKTSPLLYHLSTWCEQSNSERGRSGAICYCFHQQSPVTLSTH